VAALAALVPGYSDGLVPDSHRLPDTFHDSRAATSTLSSTERQGITAVDTDARRVIPMPALGVREADQRGKAVKIGRGPATVMGKSARMRPLGKAPGRLEADAGPLSQETCRVFGTAVPLSAEGVTRCRKVIGGSRASRSSE
jgi:hypothetical protein